VHRAEARFERAHRAGERDVQLAPRGSQRHGDRHEGRREHDDQHEETQRDEAEGVVELESRRAFRAERAAQHADERQREGEAEPRDDEHARRDVGRESAAGAVRAARRELLRIGVADCHGVPPLPVR
jgi:hypothetical protein